MRVTAEQKESVSGMSPREVLEGAHSTPLMHFPFRLRGPLRSHGTRLNDNAEPECLERSERALGRAVPLPTLKRPRIPSVLGSV